MSELWEEKRIACLTYHKYPKGEWAKEDFATYAVKYHSGVIVHVLLAQKPVIVSEVAMTEIRRLCASGHQTSILSMVKKWDIVKNAEEIFTRWCQENFFKYMLNNFIKIGGTFRRYRIR